MSEEHDGEQELSPAPLPLMRAGLEQWAEDFAPEREPGAAEGLPYDATTTAASEATLPDMLGLP